MAGGAFFDDELDAGEPRQDVVYGEDAQRAASSIQRAFRGHLARREFGELLYARLEMDLAGEPRPAALRVVRRFPPERTPSLVTLQRRFRERHGASARARGGSIRQQDDIAALMEAVEEAGLFVALGGGEQDERVAGRAFVSQLDAPFSAATAGELSLDDLHELASVLNRNIASLRSELEREEQVRADLTEQCERRERLIEQIVFRVGKHYKPRARRSSPPSILPRVR